MSENSRYDIGIIGGGLAGLALSIQLANAGFQVILIEKEQYPFHRVCGEYISMESWGFLKSLGLNLEQMELPIIHNIQVSAKNGSCVTEKLPLGGFGISRYQLDHELAKLAKSKGVVLKENTKVSEIVYNNEEFRIQTSDGVFESKVGIGSFGKRSNLDIRWKRSFVLAAKNKLNNYVGIKYHINSTQPSDTISLHWFEQGYCGIVKVENDHYNLCYLTTADNLQKSGGDIRKMEEQIICKNPELRKLFNKMIRVSDTPITISQISFDRKDQVREHLLMVGDAAGMITPLCGNGMSMALHGSKLAFEVIERYLKNVISRTGMEEEYRQKWNRAFSRRLRAGRLIQNLMSRPGIPAMFVRLFKFSPFLLRALIRSTHGKPF